MSLAGDDSAIRRETEHWFSWQGLPHFIDGYNARANVLTRMALFLAVVFVAEPFVPTLDQVPVLVRAIAGTVTVVVVLAIFVAWNRRRGRPSFTPPEHVGFWAIFVFIGVPGIEVWALTQSAADGLRIVVLNCAIFVLAYFVTSYGILPAAQFTLRVFFTDLNRMVPLLGKTIPLMLVITLLSFISPDVWLVAQEAPLQFFLIGLGLLVLVGFLLLFISTSSTLDPERLPATWHEVDELTARTPVAAIPIDGLAEPPDDSPVPRSASRNIRMVRIVVACVPIALITVVTAVFYVVFGVFMVSPGMLTVIGEERLNSIWMWDSPIGLIVVTTELIRVAFFVGFIAGLQFTVTALLEGNYRDALSDRAADHLARAIAVRRKYRAKLVA